MWCVDLVISLDAEKKKTLFVHKVKLFPSSPPLSRLRLISIIKSIVEWTFEAMSTGSLKQTPLWSTCHELAAVRLSCTLDSFACLHLISHVHFRLSKVSYVTIRNTQTQSFNFSSFRIHFAVSLCINVFSSEMDKKPNHERESRTLDHSRKQKWTRRTLRKKILFSHFVLSLSVYHLSEIEKLFSIFAPCWCVKHLNLKIKRKNMSVYESAMCQYVSGQDRLFMLG